MTQSPDPRVAVVVVAYNRRELLREVLDALAVQTYAPSRIIVVDNASTDGSADVALNAPGAVELVSLERNTGGAGGFAAGIAVALDGDDVDWIWLMDDDTVPTPTALAELVRAVDGTDVVVAGSRVVWTDGSEHPMNTPREKPFVSRSERIDAARRGAIAIRSTSFVSMLARADVVRAEGLPVADYFIWNDDFEYSTRLIRGRRALHVPASVVVHKTKTLASTDLDPGERFYYEVRNKLWMLRTSRSLSAGEKALYGASTLRRWIRTFVRSGNKAVLRGGLRRGVRDGIRTRPRRNADALDGLGETTTAVQRAEGTGLTRSPARTMTDARFSVLLPVYAGDDAAHFAKAFSSSVDDQSLKPDEVVIVQDGPVGEELNAAIRTAIESSVVPVVHHVMEENVGLARALSEGLRRCSYDIVARMDADDISLPERFASQIPVIAGGLDLVGTGMYEFLDDAGQIVGRRVPRDGQSEIERYARFHDPFSHPTVVYRRSAVEAAGGYEPLGLMEDYWLFVRMINGGARVGNIPDPLVMYRVGAGAYARRGGCEQWRSEMALQKAMRRIRFTTRLQFLRNVVIRGGYRFVPEPLRKAAYRRIIARGRL